MRRDQFYKLFHHLYFSRVDQTATRQIVEVLQVNKRSDTITQTSRAELNLSPTCHSGKVEKMMWQPATIGGTDVHQEGIFFRDLSRRSDFC